MEQAWKDENAHAKFWRNLLNSRIDLLVSSPDWLQSLRFKHDEVRWWQKKAGHIFEERGLNLYQLIAESCGECWDSEDDEKCAGKVDKKVAPPSVKEKPRQHAVSLDYPCEIGVRGQEEEEPVVQVRPSNERCQGVLQKEGSCQGLGSR